MQRLYRDNKLILLFESPLTPQSEAKIFNFKKEINL